jgi:hypothetical protein
MKKEIKSTLELLFSGLILFIFLYVTLTFIDYLSEKTDLRPHNNGQCIDNHCIGDKVIININGTTGYLSDYYKWKPSVPTEWSVTYNNDVGTICTGVFKPFELMFTK